MPDISIKFPNTNINASLQIGDIVYYVPVSTSGGFTTSSSNVVEIGPVKKILDGSEYTYVTCTIESSTEPPSTDDFIMFSKTNKVNANSVLGYYAEAKFSNNDTSHAEIFSVASEIFESSK
jgi:hypothetical protein